MADRRNSDERRGRSDRRRLKKRRHSDDRVAVVGIAGADLHLAVSSRSAENSTDRVQVAVVPWQNHATTLNSEVGARELSDALRKLSQEYQLHTAQIHFVLSGEFCVSKVIRGTIEEVRSELQQIKQRSRLYLMLGPGEKVSVSCSRPIDARHEYAVAAICNQKTLDTIRCATDNAGLKAERIEPALVSLSRVIGRLNNAPSEPCLIIHLDKSTAELGICHDGQLMLDYRPGGDTEPGALAELVRTHLSRLQRHVGRQLDEVSPKLRQIYLCGEESAIDEVYPEFEECEQFEVQRIDPQDIQATWEFENDALGSATVPALGTLLSTYMSVEDRNAPNFMEHILASKRERLGPILLRSAMPLAAMLLVACTFLFINYREQMAASTLRRQVDILLPAQGRARELKLQLSAAEARLKQLKFLAEGVQSLPATDVVSWVGQCMPSDVWLSNLVVEEMQSIKIMGASYLEAGVFDFVRWLELSPHFSDVALSSTRPGQTPSGTAINFSVEIRLGDNASSVKEVARNE